MLFTGLVALAHALFVLRESVAWISVVEYAPPYALLVGPVIWKRLEKVQ